uniref:Uncharacterized protein n=1 Tax=Arundo donax TaxID=35708 RepID=A0A0A8ZVK3_ARUDO
MYVPLECEYVEVYTKVVLVKCVSF